MNDQATVKGFVDIEYLDAAGNVVYTENLGQNLVLNKFRRLLPLLLAPQVITGRVDNSEGSTTWLNRRVALIGFGIGDGGEPPTVKPEDPEDGELFLIPPAVGDPVGPFDGAKLGLQGPIRRVPLAVDGPSEVNRRVGFGDPPNEDIAGIHLLKEVDADGITITTIPGGGAEISFTFTVEEDEYIGNIMEYGLYMGGGNASDSGPAADPTDLVRLDRENALIVARKTRVGPLEKTRDFKFRAIWRLRT